MKKLLFAALFIIAALQLKAQQLPAFKSADSLLTKAITGNLKPRPAVMALLNPQVLAVLSNDFFESRTPIIVLDGNSKMPVVKPGGYYTMPVQRIGSAGWPGAESNGLPGLQPFAVPVK